MKNSNNNSKKKERKAADDETKTTKKNGTERCLQLQVRSVVDKVVVGEVPGLLGSRDSREHVAVCVGEKEGRGKGEGRRRGRRKRIQKMRRKKE